MHRVHRAHCHWMQGLGHASEKIPSHWRQLGSSSAGSSSKGRQCADEHLLDLDRHAVVRIVPRPVDRRPPRPSSTSTDCRTDEPGPQLCPHRDPFSLLLLKHMLYFTGKLSAALGQRYVCKTGEHVSPSLCILHRSLN